MASAICRRVYFSGWPVVADGGMSGSSTAHSASVRWDGYGLFRASFIGRFKENPGASSPWKSGSLQTVNYFIGGSLFDRVTPEMRIYREEIFGPVVAWRFNMIASI